MQIKRTLKGHEFAVQLRAVERAGQLANGAPAYTAHATIYRDGRDIGSARWDVKRFAYGPMALPGAHDNEDVYRELDAAIREHLATLGGVRIPVDMSGTSNLVGRRVRATRRIEQPPLNTSPAVPLHAIGRVEDFDRCGAAAGLYAVDFGEPYGSVMTSPDEIEDWPGSSVRNASSSGHHPREQEVLNRRRRIAGT